MKPRTVIIADNHPISRAGLKILLESTPDFIVVGETTSGQQTIQMCQALKPELVLMDVSMPNGNGIDATRMLMQQFPAMMIIGISGFRHEEMQQAMLRAGAIGYLSKDASFDEILISIRDLVNGKEASSPPVEETKFELTATEHKILLLLAEGLDRQQIADRMSVSYNTIKTHFQHLYQKLNVSNAQEAVKAALTHRLIS